MPVPINAPPLARLFQQEGARIWPAMQARAFAPGEVIIGASHPPPGIFFLTSGQVRVVRSTAGCAFLPAEVLRRGDVLGAPRSACIEARAITRASALLLARDRLERLEREIPELRRALDALVEIEDGRRAFLATLRRTRAFGRAGARQLSELLREAEPVEVLPGTALVARGDSPSGIYFVLSGELIVVQAPRFGADVTPRLSRGDMFGDQAMASGAEPATVHSDRGAQLLRIPAASYARMLAISSAFRRSVGHVRRRPAQAGVAAEVAPFSAPAPPAHAIEVLLLQSDVPGAPLGVLTDLLARTLVHDHGDDVAVLELAVPEPGEPLVPGEPARDPDLPRLVRMRVPVPDGPSAGRAVEEALLRLGGAVERAFLDLCHRDERFAAALAPVLSEQQGMSVDGRPIARGKVVLLSRDPLAQNLPEPLRAVPVSSAALLGGPPRAAGPPQAPRARLVPAGAARLRLDLDQLATLERPEERRLEALPPATRATLSRWGRIITERAVGVALGGGGAWGFAHLTLIRHMHAAGVPIDMISGSSFGALVGAFYCRAGLDGLDQLLRLGREANRAVAASWLSSRALARFVDEQLGGARLEDLEVPLFPVVTDLASGTQDVVWSGTLGQGVRASGAFPGMYTPVTGGGVHWVDGGFVNNVPASVLLEEGADLIVASNIVAAPAPAPPPEPLFSGDLGRLLHELNPIQRALDLVRAGFVLMHTTGARESDLADVAFESDPVELPLHERRSLRDRILRGWIPFWDFTAGPHVAEKATAKVLIAVDQIKGRWEQLSRAAGGA